MIEYPWDYVFAIISAGGSVATAAALFFLWRQYKQTEEQIHLTQEEVEGKLRPWIGIDDVRRTEHGAHILIRNTGSIAAKIVRAQRFYSHTMITQEHLRSGEDIPGNIVILPNINKTIRRRIFSRPSNE